MPEGRRKQEAGDRKRVTGLRFPSIIFADNNALCIVRVLWLFCICIVLQSVFLDVVSSWCSAFCHLVSLCVISVFPFRKFMGPASYHKEIMAHVAFITTSLKAFACIWSLMTFAVGASFVSTANDSCRFLLF